MREKFKDIEGYDGVYQVSNFGNVKSFKCGEEGRILKPGVNANGYLIVALCKDGKRKTCNIHQLVAIAFLGHTPDGRKSMVDHIDNKPFNNHVDNLQILEQDGNISATRQNSSRSKTDCGVYWNKRDKKWESKIRIGDKQVYLGLFTEKQDGLDQYKKALENIHLFNGDKKQFRNKIIII